VDFIFHVKWLLRFAVFAALLSDESVDLVETLGPSGDFFVSGERESDGELGGTGYHPELIVGGVGKGLAAERISGPVEVVWARVLYDCVAGGIPDTLDRAHI